VTSFTSRDSPTTWATLKKKPFNNIISWEDLPLFCFWQIWLSRNNNLFNNRKDMVNTKANLAKATEYIPISVNRTTTKQKTIWVKCTPPLTNTYKLNTDRVAVGNPEKGGVGGAFRNAGGNWMLGYMRSIQHTTNTQAKLLALLKGLQIVEERQLTPLEINTDSTEVIRMLINGNLIFDSIIFECRSIVQRLGDVVVKHSFREMNKVADLLAKEGAKKDFFYTIFVTAVPPVFATHVFCADIVGTAFSRQVLECNIDNYDHLEGELVYP
ncbi:hypothetical protein A4A49_64036, partial [Nicotiana attenuata]